MWGLSLFVWAGVTNNLITIQGCQTNIHILSDGHLSHISKLNITEHHTHTVAIFLWRPTP